MEAIIQEKVLSQFVNDLTPETSIIRPINVDFTSLNVERMNQYETMITNDKKYFIRYGGFLTSGSYNAIEIYSIDSMDDNAAVYVFDNIVVDNKKIQLTDLKQDSDGRFYGVGRYFDGTNNYTYMVIFNNFIQDGVLKVNKYYSSAQIGVSLSSSEYFRKITKKDNSGIYFLSTNLQLIRFEINILEGNQTSVASIVYGGGLTDYSVKSQLNVLGENVILTFLASTDDYKFEYTKAIINLNEELPQIVTLQSIYARTLNANTYVNDGNIFKYNITIPYVEPTQLGFKIEHVDLNGKVTTLTAVTSTSLGDSYIYLKDMYAILATDTMIEVYYADYQNYTLIPFYRANISNGLSKAQIINQYNVSAIFGVSGGVNPKISCIKNIYSSNVTSSPYYNKTFCLPYYLNVYSDISNNKSLLFSRDATARFYSGNQITSTFIIPNYLLNDGNMKMANVYGKTNYLLNSEIKDFEKNRFESLYFNFIYNLNVIDNTNALNTLNQIGSNKVANGLWKAFDNYDLRLTKARITYEDLSTEIINLNIPTVTENSVTFNFVVTGNITKIEYLSNDESVVYATFRTNLTGTNTITQTIRVE